MVVRPFLVVVCLFVVVLCLFVVVVCHFVAVLILFAVVVCLFMGALRVSLWSFCVSVWLLSVSLRESRIPVTVGKSLAVLVFHLFVADLPLFGVFCLIVDTEVCLSPTDIS